MTETVKDKIERYKLLAEDFLKTNTRVAIWDIYGEYYFADILLVGDDLLTIYAFSPISKVGKHYLRWAVIERIVEYRQKEESIE